MLHLYLERRKTTSPRGHQLSSCWSQPNPSGSAVVAYPAHVCHTCDVCYFVTVSVIDSRNAHVRDRAIVLECASLPISAVETSAGISKAVVHAAVKAYVLAPVSLAPSITAPIVAPIPRSPKRAVVGSQDPHARDPVITGRRVAPVTRRPDVVVSRAFRLAVLGQRRRRLRSIVHRRFLGLVGVAAVAVVISCGIFIVRGGLRVLGRRSWGRAVSRLLRIIGCGRIGWRGWRAVLLGQGLGADRGQVAPGWIRSRISVASGGRERQGRQKRHAGTKAMPLHPSTCFVPQWIHHPSHLPRHLLRHRHARRKV
jgi:hypothetical protein